MRPVPRLETTELVDANGRKRELQRFTLHGLRDRYACTAVDEWDFPQSGLLAQGGWEDIETIRRYYYGVTDDTNAQVRARIG